MIGTTFTRASLQRAKVRRGTKTRLCSESLLKFLGHAEAHRQVYFILFSTYKQLTRLKKYTRSGYERAVDDNNDDEPQSPLFHDRAAEDFFSRSVTCYMKGEISPKGISSRLHGAWKNFREVFEPPHFLTPPWLHPYFTFPLPGRLVLRGCGVYSRSVTYYLPAALSGALRCL